MASTVKVFPVSAMLCTVLETDVLEHDQDLDVDDDYGAIRQAWNGAGLAVAGDTTALRVALAELSNHCDDNAELNPRQRGGEANLSPRCRWFSRSHGSHS